MSPLYDPLMPVVARSFVPLYCALGPDHYADLARFWARQRANVCTLLECLQTRYDHVILVADGAALCAQQQMPTTRCPACHLSTVEIATANGAPLPDGAAYPAGYPVSFASNVPFVDQFATARAIWRGFSIPPLNVIWGPGHLFAHTLSRFMDSSADFLDAHYPGRSVAWYQEISARHPLIRQRGISLSWEECKRIGDDVDFPLPQVTVLDQYFLMVRLMLNCWRRPSRFGGDACALFGRTAAELADLHVRIFGRRMVPSVHYLLIHLPAQWAYFGAADDFPRAASEEVGEKSHVAASADWIRSLMTVRNRRTGGETGLTELLRTTYLQRAFCSERLAAAAAAATADAAMVLAATADPDDGSESGDSD